MPTHGKRLTDAVKRFDRQQLHGPGEAVDLIKSLASAKFDETIEMSVRLGIDPRKDDQRIRGTVALPAGTGKTARVAVFAAGDAATRLVRPVPSGSERVPRTIWSALRGSTPSRMATSTVASNFTGLDSLASRMASAGG